MQWPLEHAQVIGEYDAPVNNGCGHRGLDLRARPQDAIIAPADGVVAFSGKVAGKSVVTLRHGAETGSLTSTFEPGGHYATGRGRHRQGGAFRSC